MRFSEIAREASALLKDKERAPYRMLRREFDLDNETLEDLKFELINTDRIAGDEDGAILVLASSLSFKST